MRNGSLSPPSPTGSVSGESFFLHDPQEVIYNRVKDLFDSDGSNKDDSSRKGGHHARAMTGELLICRRSLRSNILKFISFSNSVQAEVHSSSSGAASGSDEDISVDSSNSSHNRKQHAPQIKRSNSKNNHDHDYEDIYLVREEARHASKNLTKNKMGPGRSRSRDSGSHSRSASASSTRSNDVIVQFSNNVRYIKST